MKPWFHRSPAALDAMRVALRSSFPSLWVGIDDSAVALRGTLPLFDPLTGSEFDRYEIAVEFSKDYPKTVPAVRETGGRIPWCPERHNTNGTACLFVPEERERCWPEGSDIVALLRGPVTQFFFGQSFYEQHGRWPFGEWSHGTVGRYEFYAEAARSDNPEVVVGFMRMVAAREPRGHWPCYCGSGLRMRACHFQTLLEFRRVTPRKTAQDALDQLAQDVLRHRAASTQQETETTSSVR
jgi:hypothetical protein